MDFEKRVALYLNETKAAPAGDDLGKRIKIIAKTELGKKIPDTDSIALRDDPTFMPRTKSTIVGTNPDARDDGELFADIMEKAGTNPGLRIKMQAVKVNPSATRSSFIRAYMKAEKKFGDDEGKRMNELKILYYFIKKNLRK